MSIISFNNKDGKGLKLLFEKGDASKVDAARAQLIYDLLLHLDSAQNKQDLNLPGRRLHPYKEYKPQRWSLDVNGNYRLMFEWDDECKGVRNLMYVDPHNK